VVMGSGGVMCLSEDSITPVWHGTEGCSACALEGLQAVLRVGGRKFSRKLFRGYRGLGI
jgi:hypothetical protein